MPGAVPDSAIGPGLSPAVSNKTAEAFSAKAFSLTLLLSSSSWSSSLKKILPTFIIGIYKENRQPYLPRRKKLVSRPIDRFFKDSLKGIGQRGRNGYPVVGTARDIWRRSFGGNDTYRGGLLQRDTIAITSSFLLLTIALYYTAYTLTFILHSRFHRENG